MGWLRILEKMATLYHIIISLQEVQQYNKLGVMYLTMFYVVIDVNEIRFYFINKSSGLLSELHHDY